MKRGSAPKIYAVTGEPAALGRVLADCSDALTLVSNYRVAVSTKVKNTAEGGRFS